MRNVATKAKISIINMKLEKQVCCLELANRLKELGVKQESLYSHVFRRNQNVDAKAWFLYSSERIREGKVWDSKIGELMPIQLLIEKEIAAFTVAEVGEMLPEAFLWDGTTQVGLYCGKYTEGWHVYYKAAGKRIHYEDGRTEADARARMLIYLLEQKLITL
jgi:hypothetical protein